MNIETIDNENKLTIREKQSVVLSAIIDLKKLGLTGQEVTIDTREFAKDHGLHTGFISELCLHNLALVSSLDGFKRTICLTNLLFEPIPEVVMDSLITFVNESEKPFTNFVQSDADDKPTEWVHSSQLNKDSEVRLGKPFYLTISNGPDFELKMNVYRESDVELLRNVLTHLAL